MQAYTKQRFIGPDVYEQGVSEQVFMFDSTEAVVNKGQDDEMVGFICYSLYPCDIYLFQLIRSFNLGICPLVRIIVFAVVYEKEGEREGERGNLPAVY